MNLFIRFTIIVLSVTAVGCASSKKIKQLSADGQEAYHSGDCQKALAMYEEIIAIRTSASRPVPDSIYHKAGVCALKTSSPMKAIDYMVKVRQSPSVNPETYHTLALAYRGIDNLSLELDALRQYVQNYPSGPQIAEVRKQLFEAYVRSSNWEAAHQAWQTLNEEAKKSIEILTGYLTVIRRLGHDNVVEVANRILHLDNNNMEALEAIADTYYRMAESQYQEEMKVYNSNRTNAQYRRLLSVLEGINANFRKSRDLYERLYRMDAKPRYAFYLGNIYTRFENKERAAYYLERAKGE